MFFQAAWGHLSRPTPPADQAPSLRSCWGEASETADKSLKVFREEIRRGKRLAYGTGVPHVCRVD